MLPWLQAKYLLRRLHVVLLILAIVRVQRRLLHLRHPQLPRFVLCPLVHCNATLNHLFGQWFKCKFGLQSRMTNHRSLALNASIYFGVDCAVHLIIMNQQD
jgi:hypothetical protein